MPIDDLLAVCTPPPIPVEQPTPQQWKDLEDAVGHALPSDYKALQERYGIGAFGAYQDDGAFFDLLFTLSPGTTRNDLGALPLMMELTKVIGEIRRRWPDLVAEPAYPEAGGLLYVGGTTTTHCIYWKTVGAADAWTCVVCDRPCEQWFAWNGDLTSLLAAMVTGQVPGWIVDGAPSFPLVFTDLDTLETTRLA